MIFQSAFELAKKGYSVIPLREGSKLPATPNGFKNASKDEDVLKEWLKLNPSFNIGIATGLVSGLTVVDVDVKNGHKGKESLKSLNLPPTLTVKTPTGGWHLYFKYNPSIKSAIGILDGIDIKSDGGYVVAPPSTTPEGVYEFVNDHEIVELKQIENLVVKDYKPPKEEGALINANRNNTLTSIAGAMRRQGMTEDEIYHAIQKVNENRCSPPLEDWEICDISKHIAKYPPKQIESRPTDIQMADMIIEKVKETDLQYSEWQGDIWMKIKVDRPKLANKVHEMKEEIDNEYARYKKNKSSKTLIEKRILDYKNIWKEVSALFPR